MRRSSAAYYLFGSALLVSAVAPLRAGTVDELFLTVYDQSNNPYLQVVHGSSVVRQWSLRSTQWAPAVADTVRVRGFLGPEDFGSEYTLQGVWTGVDYPLNEGVPGAYDGTTDGTTTNFGLGSWGNVYAHDREWHYTTELFDLGPEYDWGGVAYDLNTGHLWFARQSGLVQERTLDGTLVSEFSTGYSNQAGLAWEPSTDSLWIALNDGQLVNYTKAGEFVEIVDIPELLTPVGAEFPIPEPASAGLLVLGGLLMLVLQRK